MIGMILLGCFVVVAGLVWFHGFGNNLIAIVQLLLAGFIATAFFEPCADQLAGLSTQWQIYWDFLSVWVLFAVSYTLLRLVSEVFASRSRILFAKPVEIAGRSITAPIVAYVFVMFAGMTMHTAPVPAEQFTPPSLLGIPVDKQWMDLSYTVSGGSLAGSSPGPNASFESRYASRRR